MSDVIKQFKNPIYLILAIAAVALFFVFDSLLLEDNAVLSGFLAVLIVGFVGLLYNDFVEKRRLEDERKAKTQDLNRRKKVQMEKEVQEGKCISCLAPLPTDARECPNCGFKVKRYSMKDEDIKK